MQLVEARELRAEIAAHVLGPATDGQLGDITLHAHQHDAVGRLRRILDDHGGALLADDVGLGKTYAALGVVRGGERVVVIAPAAVREHWIACATHARVEISFHSMESLSRGGAPAVEADLVIIDEAHHFRTARTRRHAAARQLCRRARVLLLTATPIQNRDDDLRTMLSLFLGSRADALSGDGVAAFIVRRVATDLHEAQVRLPDVRPPQWLPFVDDVDCLDRILALPPPVPPTDGGDGGILVTFSLLRQWTSSRAALTGALRGRLARGLAMIDALRVGRMPSRDELASWCHADDAQQLAFPELVRTDAADAAGHLLAQTERHVEAVRALLDWLAHASHPDAHRARALLALLERHRGERVVAFSEYADTVAAMFALVAPFARAAMLRHGGGRLASGPISRAEVLAQFSAGASRRAHERDRIDLLLTTDVLSEGVNLPDASVIVHLDLAWNPARLEQRVGRLRRVNSQHQSIAVYLMPPPAPAERMLQLERRLRVKRAVAHRTLGVAGAILPGDDASAAAAPGLRATERMAAVLQSWGGRGSSRRGGAAAAAAVRADESGAIACVRVNGAVGLLAVTESGVTDDVGVVQRLCAAAGGDSIAVDRGAIEHARTRVHRYLRERRLFDGVGHTALHVARTRRELLRRADAIALGASRDMRPRLAPLLHAVRTAASAPLSAGAERALQELATSDAPDDAWLRAISEFATSCVAARSDPPAEILALLLLRRG